MMPQSSLMEIWNILLAVIYIFIIIIYTNICNTTQRDDPQFQSTVANVQQLLWKSVVACVP